MARKSRPKRLEEALDMAREAHSQAVDDLETALDEIAEWDLPLGFGRD